MAFAQLHLRAETPSCVPVFPSAELRRIYVDKDLHGSGLARQLLARVLGAAADSGVEGVWLGVWEHNPRAIRFYQSAGFSKVGDHVFTVGTDPQRDLLMARNLTSGDPLA